MSNQIQRSIHEAFLWIRQLYDEARVLLDDAQRIAGEMGFQAPGVVTAYAAALRENDYPFVHLAAVFFWPSATYEEDAGTAMFLAVDFHSVGREGPHCFVGTVRHSASDKVGKDLLVHTAKRLGDTGYFTTKKPAGDEVVFVHKPSAAYKGFAGVEEVRHVEFPLTFLDTPEKLRRVLEGAVALRSGDEAVLRSLVKESAAPTGAAPQTV